MLVLPQDNDAKVAIQNVPVYCRTLEAFGMHPIQVTPTTIMMARRFPDTNAFGRHHREGLSPALAAEIQRAVRVL